MPSSSLGRGIQGFGEGNQNCLAERVNASSPVTPMKRQFRLVSLHQTVRVFARRNLLSNVQETVIFAARRIGAGLDRGSYAATV